MGTSFSWNFKDAESQISSRKKNVTGGSSQIAVFEKESGRPFFSLLNLEVMSKRF